MLLSSLLFFILLTETKSVMKMTKFCANLSFLFTEKPFLERYKLAEKAGFKCVESGFPFGFTKDQVLNAKNSTSVEQVLVNIYTGDVTKGELGFAAIPSKEEDFKKSLETTVEYAKALNARKIHVMSGKILEQITPAHDKIYEQNLKYAADFLGKHNILALIEPINKNSVPNYYMNSYEKAIEVIQRINSPNLKLMLDVFHLQQIQGNITKTIKELIKHVGHVQIAQVPHRHEPNEKGELNYKYIFDLLANEGYDDWIGLEYNPAKDTSSGLKWIQEMGYSL